MIPRENLYKENRFKFKNILCDWGQVAGYIFSECNLSRFESESVMNSVKAISEENIVIPLEFMRSRFNPKDKSGCRIYDWKILSNEQIKTAMRIHGDYEIIKVPHVPITHFFASVLSDGDPLTIPDGYESYSKLLNITYLVSDEFLQDWCNPDYVEKKISKKDVKDCTVSELLFAIKKKLK